MPGCSSPPVISASSRKRALLWGSAACDSWISFRATSRFEPAVAGHEHLAQAAASQRPEELEALTIRRNAVECDRLMGSLAQVGLELRGRLDSASTSHCRPGARRWSESRPWRSSARTAPADAVCVQALRAGPRERRCRRMLPDCARDHRGSTPGDARRPTRQRLRSTCRASPDRPGSVATTCRGWPTTSSWCAKRSRPRQISTGSQPSRTKSGGQHRSRACRLSRAEFYPVFAEQKEEARRLETATGTVAAGIRPRKTTEGRSIHYLGGAGRPASLCGRCR